MYPIKLILGLPFFAEKQIDLIGAVFIGYFESVWIENENVEFNYRDNNRATEFARFKDYLNEKLNKSRQQKLSALTRTIAETLANITR